MAYCRWSDCDVYVYEDVSGVWVTHVAVGMSFNDASPGECADRLTALKAEGFDVPQDAIDTLREEQAEMDRQDADR